MKAALAILKQHIFNIACGLCVVAAIALGVVGMGKMSDVVTELEKVKALHGKFAPASRKPTNYLTIKSEKARVETVKRYYNALIEKAYEINRYEPLKPPPGEQFFPTPTRHGPLTFERVYMSAFDAMLLELGACQPPGELEIEREEEIISEEKRAEASFNLDSDQPGSSGTRGKRGKSGGDTATKHPSGLITYAGAMESAEARASIRIAKRGRCYASLQSFDIRRAMFAGMSPNVDDMWAAQLSLFIQQDVVHSIARINDQAVKDVRVEGGKAWVGVLPVKELISIRTSDYLPGEEKTPANESRLLGSVVPLPAGSSASVFTKTDSTDLYEVIQFTVKMVVDLRDLEVIIDGISRDRFHTLLNVGYVYDRKYLENLDMEGKIFGSEPTAIVVLDFETIMFGDIYRRLMPDSVLSKIGKERPKDEDDAS